MPTGRPRIENWANGGTTTLNGAINDSATSLIVTSTSGFPTYPDFKIKIDSEYLTVTGISGSTFTVVRGADGTTPASHSDAATVEHIVSVEGLERAYKDNYAADHTNGFPYNRILNEGATATASTFTWFNQGSGTCVDADDGGLVMTTGVSESLNQLRGKELTSVPATPWFCAAYIHLGNGMANYDGVGAGTSGGIMARENSTGKIYYLFVRTDVIAMWRMTNSTTFSADVDSFIDANSEEVWLRMGDNGSDVFGEVSYNGWDWDVCFNEVRTSFMSGGIDRIGFGMMNGNADADAEVYFKSWILY